MKDAANRFFCRVIGHDWAWLTCKRCGCRMGAQAVPA